MEDIDKNGDGFIDLEEYIGETLATMSPPGREELPECPFPSFPLLEFHFLL